MSFFPRPDYLFILDAEVKTIINRKKSVLDNNISYNSISAEKRNTKDAVDLQQQRQRYLHLASYLQKNTNLKATIIDTNLPLATNLNTIVQKSWKWLVFKQNK